MLVIAFTNVSKIYILGKQDYKKSKKEVKSQKQRAEKKNSAIRIQVKKKPIIHVLIYRKLLCAKWLLIVLHFMFLF